MAAIQTAYQLGQPVNTLDSISNVVPSYSTLPRWALNATGVTMLTSQAMLAVELIVPGGVTLHNLGYTVGNTGATTPLNQWLALMNQSRQILGVTADQLTAGIGAFGTAQFGMTSPVVVPGSPGALQFLYICMMVNATTVPNLCCAASAGNVFSTPPVVCNAGTGLTSPPAVGTVMPALTSAAAGNMPYLFAN